MMLSSTHEVFHRWYSVGGAICAARHCAEETGASAAMMHCSGDGEQTELSVAAQRHACPSPEALPATQSVARQLRRRAAANTPQAARFSIGLQGVRPESDPAVAFFVFIPPSPQQSGSSLSS